MNDLLNQLLVNSSEVNNLLLVDWSLTDWSRLELSFEMDNLLLDNLNSSDDLIDLLLEDVDGLVLFWINLRGRLLESWLAVSNSSDSSLEVGNLLSELLNDLSELSDILLDDWSLLLWSSLVNSSEVDNLSLDNVNLLGDLGDLLLEDMDDMLFRLVQWSNDFFLNRSWVRNVVDNMLDVINLVDQLSDNLSVTDNLLLDDWLLLDRGGSVLLLEDGDLLSDNVDLGDSLLNSLLEYSNDLSLDRRWCWSWSWISDSDYGSLDDIDLLNILSDNVLKNNNLSSDGWSLLNWSRDDLVFKNLNGLSNLSDLVSDVSNLLGEDSDDLLGDWSYWSWKGSWLFWLFSSWSARWLWLGKNEGNMSAVMVSLAVFVTGWDELLTGFKGVSFWMIHRILLAINELVFTSLPGNLILRTSLLEDLNGLLNNMNGSWGWEGEWLS